MNPSDYLDILNASIYPQSLYNRTDRAWAMLELMELGLDFGHFDLSVDHSLLLFDKQPDFDECDLLCRWAQKELL